MIPERESHKKFLEKKFGRIVRYYDLVNSILSLFQDRFWRKKLSGFLKDTEGPLLDLCCGPFTLSLEILRRRPREIHALDLSFEMLSFGMVRSQNHRPYLFPIRGDAERLPFKDTQFSALTIAFGLRNLPHVDLAIDEFFRVLRENGLLLILEFSLPKNPIIRALYLPYLKYIVPFLGGVLTGDREAYQYLSQSIQKFSAPEVIEQKLIKRGFSKIAILPMTFGVVTLYVFKKGKVY